MHAFWVKVLQSRNEHDVLIQHEPEKGRGDIAEAETAGAVIENDNDF